MLTSDFTENFQPKPIEKRCDNLLNLRENRTMEALKSKLQNHYNCIITQCFQFYLFNIPER